MKYLLYVIILLVTVSSCKKKENIGQAVQLDDRNFIYDSYAKEYYYDSDRDFVFGIEACKKAKIDSAISAKKKEYYEISDSDLQIVKSVLNNFLERNDSLQPLQNYFRQYVGYKTDGRKYVYVNLGTHVQCRGESQPYLPEEIYEENDEKYSFGHVIIDLNEKKVVDNAYVPSTHDYRLSKRLHK